MKYRYLCFLFLLFCSCEKKTPVLQRQELRISMERDPHTLDPRKARDFNSLCISRLLYEGLMRIDEEGEAQFACAEKVEVEDQGKRYLFHLRESCWENGDPVTAGDFVEAWRSVVNPIFPSDNGYLLYVIKNAALIKKGEISPSLLGVRAIDNKTLEVELEYSAPYFLKLCAFPTFFPMHYAADGETLVSNGPFKLQEWRPYDNLKIVKNSNYWDERVVSMEEITFFILDSHVALLFFEKGELDWVGSPFSMIDFDALDNLKKKPGFHTKPVLGTCFFRVNTEVIPLNSLAFRQAISFAIDRPSITENVLKGCQIPAASFLPPCMKSGKKCDYLKAHSVQALQSITRAAEELEISLSNLAPLQLIYSVGERGKRVCQAVQQQLIKDLGIEVEIEAVEKKVFFDRIAKGNYQLALGDWYADFNDPHNFLEVFKYAKTAINGTGWENREFSDLLDHANKIDNPIIRCPFFGKCETILMQELPCIPIYHNSMVYLKNPKLAGERFTCLGTIDFKSACFKDEN